ncbi:ABC transporter ATP-binding protein [Aminiphilus sp.]|jgi:oligopeptide transport system ATP-binding protein|uniref:ABC transporter ATP-binding protein n=1 Tax=Aminiphilus sp. TaxID=1872488 RepID=UPI0026233A7D|nr:ABC transporter ATP-binding protein [Aminiphilus sp.]
MIGTEKKQTAGSYPPEDRSVAAGKMETAELLRVENLYTSFFTHVGEVKALRGIDFSLKEGEAFGIVGESGSGKSVTSLSILRLLPYPGRVTAGRVLFRGEDLLAKSEREMRSLRGDDLTMIFQDPMTSLNPVFTVGEQIVEVLRLHRKISKKEAWERAVEGLRLVGIPSPEKRVRDYPHQFSGGMRQRAMIAMSLACEPALLIADEPTTALDVTIQAQMLDLMNDLRAKIRTAIILITHDLGVVSEVCSRILVMYGGQVMEEAASEELFATPLHPYTVGLLRALPGYSRRGNAEHRLVPIPGTPPDLLHPPRGCPFVERCPLALRVCRERPPHFSSPGPGRRVACWLHDAGAPASARERLFAAREGRSSPEKEAVR